MGPNGRLRIIVGGYLGLLPGGGVAWDYVQYPVGFAELGHDVFYIEDTAVWPVYHPDGAAGAVAQLGAVMEAFGLGDRWAYRDVVEDRWHGPCAGRIDELVRTADVLINVSCSTFLREEYRRIPVRALIDSDPMFTQIQYINEGFEPGQTSMRSTVDGHTHHFSFGENIGRADCRVPECGVTWRTTRQPVSLDRWPATPLPDDPSAGFTTVMNWSALKALHYQGESWGQKDVELMGLVDLPSRRPGLDLAIALAPTAEADAARRMLGGHGWSVFGAADVAGDWRSYQDFVGRSLGEFSVAKQTYVKARTGWFSCRSACYLAAGRPVVAQETGWSSYVPQGEGLLAFVDEDTALAALDSVCSDPPRHARAAREIAQAYFDSRVVLGDLVSEFMSSP